MSRRRQLSWRSVVAGGALVGFGIGGFTIRDGRAVDRPAGGADSTIAHGTVRDEEAVGTAELPRPSVTEGGPADVPRATTAPGAVPPPTPTPSNTTLDVAVAPGGTSVDASRQATAVLPVSPIRIVIKPRRDQVRMVPAAPQEAELAVRSSDAGGDHAPAQLPAEVSGDDSPASPPRPVSHDSSAASSGSPASADSD